MRFSQTLEQKCKKKTQIHTFILISTETSTDCVRIRQILRRSGIKYKKGEKREQVTVKRVHAAQLGRGDTQLHTSLGGGGGGSKQNRQKHCSGTFMYALHVLSRF